MKDVFEFAAKARNLLDELAFMNLATSSADAMPWNSPVFYAYDGDYFYWLSTTDSRHSQNINENPHVSIVLFDSTKPDGEGFGVYFSALAEKVPENALDDLQKAHNASYQKAGKTPVDAALYTGDYPRKYYRARPTAAWVNTNESRNGVVVDVRQEVSLESLKPA